MTEANRLAAWLTEGAWHKMTLGDVIAAGRELRRLQAENEAQKARVRELCDLIRKVHKAKGRYHTQLAMCDLFDGLGLSNERPDAARAKEQTP